LFGFGLVLFEGEEDVFLSFLSFVGLDFGL
jgi:hypothetical protein